MNIRSTQIRTQAPLSPLAKLDKELASGVLPEDVYIRDAAGSQDAEVFSEAKAGAIKLSDGSEKIEDWRSGVWGRRALSTAGGLALAAPGALLGTVGVPGNPVLGAAIGAGVGLAIHWDNIHRDDTGLITFEHNGEVTKKEWEGFPQNHTKTPEELHTILHSTGVLGDRVQVVAEPKIEGEIKTEILAALEEHKTSLNQLAKERRLLANLGGETRYGKEALQTIDARTARELLSRGKSVEVVSVENLNDEDHNLTSRTYFEAYSKKFVESYSYTARDFDYKLQTIESPEDLELVQDGEGLPDTTAGVPAEGDHFTQTVYKSKGKAHRFRLKDGDEKQSRFREAMLGSAKPQSNRGLAGSLKSMVDPSTVGYTAAGAILGAAAGSGIPGLDPGAAATIGGVVGHFVGRSAVKRAAKRDVAPEWAPAKAVNPVNKWAAIAAGTAVGLGAGFMASQATGENGQFAAMALAAGGGACTGFVAGKPRGNIDRAMMTGSMGMAAGFATGFARSLGYSNLATTIVITALSGALGGSAAWLAMRPKH